VAAARAAWHADLAGIAAERLVFIDECGIDTRLVRTHARAPRGERAVGRVPWGRRRLTLIGALGLGGIVAMMTITAAADAAVFRGFLEAVLAPALQRRPEAVLVLDNLSAHKTPAVRAALGRAGISHRYLPSYSPDFSPMEPCWAKLKAHFRTRPRAASRRSKRNCLQRSAPSRRTTPKAGSGTANTFRVMCRPL
jgi:transposase